MRTLWGIHSPPWEAKKDKMLCVDEYKKGQEGREEPGEENQVRVGGMEEESAGSNSWNWAALGVVWKPSAVESSWNLRGLP